MVLQPQYCLDNIGLGSSAFARHYLRNHYYFLLLWVLRCFSSPRLLLFRGDRPSTWRVAPFGNLWIKSYLQIPIAYRSLSRPSSPPRAKASTVCPCLLSFPVNYTRMYVADWYITQHFIAFVVTLLFCPSCQRSFFLYYYKIVWRITDSNRWPPACKAGALASWANPPKFYVRFDCIRSPRQSWTADLYIISVAL